MADPTHHPEIVADALKFIYEMNRAAYGDPGFSEQSFAAHFRNNTPSRIRAALDVMDARATITKGQKDIEDAQRVVERGEARLARAEDDLRKCCTADPAAAERTDE